MRSLSVAASLAAVTLPLALTPAAADDKTRADRTTGHKTLGARIDRVVDTAIAEGRIAGAVILVAEDGQLIHRRAAGHLDREAGLPMREDAIFRFASVSKPFVAAAALALVDDGVLDPDAPITRHLPGFRPATSDGDRPVITLRQLLSHTAGLDYGFFQPADGPYARAGISDGLDDRPGLTLAENLRRLALVPLRNRPGAAWHYSLAIDVAGGLIEAATGRPLPDVVREKVTAPLGLEDTGFTVADTTRLAVAYMDGPEGGVPRRMAAAEAVPFGGSAVHYAPGRILDPDAWPSGGAGMAGTAADVLALLEAIRTGGGRVLSPGMAAAFARPATGDLPLDVSGPGWAFGLGAAVLTDPALAGSPQSPGTWAWGGAYGHSWFVDPVRKLTVVAMTNTALAGMTGAFPDALRDAIYAD
ncbi:serine hydrolase [Tistrella mobilis]|uniref:Serine hydrolase n=1 Tax=Tistrella mobilis TaxID=171437 RepID=A0A162KDT2_9PROT|nr:serine hydrolase domain-containing protein [Tistrella mobilis]KYO51035.1 serine hydrolase [Tistrella mobilis]